MKDKMKHYIISEKSTPVGDGEWAKEYECNCGESLEIIFSNGTRYGEQAGEFHRFYPPNLECPLLIELLDEYEKKI